ncbi:MAG TPA: NUDIX hydrolase [Methylomirabilota bacterium]|nr:NUDIX hydrolase [Methylomirabilota bacterium]
MADPAHPPYRHISPETIRFCPLCGAGLVATPMGPDKRPEMVCSGCGFIFYMTQKVVAGTIPWQDGRLLLTRRAIDPAIGKWTFPGGYVDWGETVDAAALRETWEETGLTVELGGLVGVYSYANAPVVIVVYRAQVLGGALTLCHENDRLEWVTPAEVPWEELAFPSTVAAMRDFLARPGDGDHARSNALPT